jgi:hypothetical protein
VGGIAGANPHQDGVLVVGMGRFDRVTDVAGIGHGLSSHFKNDVAFLEAPLRGGAVRIDVGDNDAVFTGSRDRARRRNRQAKPWNIRTMPGIGIRFLHGGQIAQGKIDGLVPSLVQNVELDRAAGRKIADGTGEFPRILDRLAIHRGDDIAGFDAGLGRRSVGLGFRNQCAFGLFETKTIGNVLRYRLNLDADPAAADRALIL